MQVKIPEKMKKFLNAGRGNFKVAKVGEFGYNTSSCYASAAARQQTVPTAEAEREEQAMASTYSVPLSELVNEFDLNFFYKASDYEKIHVTVDDVSRPGLHLAGFFDHFEPMRIYVCGTVEMAYLQKLSHEERTIIFDRFLSYKIPVLMIARGYEPLPECLEMAKKYDVTVLGSHAATSYVVSSLITYLKQALAPRVTRHGVLVEISGEGILINGDSGIGKSETAIELVKRGHRLIADDAVEIKRISDTLHGTAPELIRHYIEIRGVGVIDVKQLFGMGAVQFETEIDLVIQLEQWQDGKFYDRLGLGEETYTLLDVSLPIVTIPVRPGRNLAGIVEIATMKNRQTKYGYNAGRDFVTQFDSKLDAMTQQNGSDLL